MLATTLPLELVLGQITIPPVSPTVLLTLLQLAVTVAGAWFAIKFQISKLTEGQAEMLRQLTALHARLDRHAERIKRVETDTAILMDRSNRSTQRLIPMRQDVFPEGDSE